MIWQNSPKINNSLGKKGLKVDVRDITFCPRYSTVSRVSCKYKRSSIKQVIGNVLSDKFEEK